MKSGGSDRTAKSSAELDKGAYLLLIRIRQTEEIKIGKAGTIQFQTGYYVYAGSALSGLTARIKRHQKRLKKLQWHVDYLLVRGELVDVKRLPSSVRQECSINGVVKDYPSAAGQIPGFGASDCRCSSHLTYFRRKPLLGDLVQSLRKPTESTAPTSPPA